MYLISCVVKMVLRVLQLVLKEKLAVPCLLTVYLLLSPHYDTRCLNFHISFTMVMVGKLTNRFIVYSRLSIINSSLANKATA